MQDQSSIAYHANRDTAHPGVDPSRVSRFLQMDASKWWEGFVFARSTSRDAKSDMSLHVLILERLAIMHFLYLSNNESYIFMMIIISCY